MSLRLALAALASSAPPRWPTIRLRFPRSRIAEKKELLFSDDLPGHRACRRVA